MTRILIGLIIGLNALLVLLTGVGTLTGNFGLGKSAWMCPPICGPMTGQTVLPPVAVGIAAVVVGAAGLTVALIASRSPKE